MTEHELPSNLLEQAVNEMSRLPGIGRKTALRLILHLLREEKKDALKLGESLTKLVNDIHYCTVCHNITENEVCDICSDSARDHKTICVVEDIRDLLAIENTQQYNGVYHVLGGIISPIDGVGPGDLTIDLLMQRLEGEMPDEIIFALPTTMEGDTTNYYLHKQIAGRVDKITTLARGLSFGDELQYADEVTLGRSLVERIDYQTS
ncbi:Recombination protein RecR [Salinivirga cyanobacteriivorans]|uniref:Recombination protein RecR n=1 Tax=Salinivirga cyanobacteriivorans TaxID=1307839 RepID=A0A0S2HWW7_9BACT|nr:recombination mediator RecR [Salinivirga cyanobacteriivorans]ALO14554.1 Recombination protein RecR [Salinivirga cyanobacteriivorans]